MANGFPQVIIHQLANYKKSQGGGRITNFFICLHFLIPPYSFLKFPTLFGKHYLHKFPPVYNLVNSLLNKLCATVHCQFHHVNKSKGRPFWKFVASIYGRCPLVGVGGVKILKEKSLALLINQARALCVESFQLQFLGKCHRSVTF